MIAGVAVGAFLMPPGAVAAQSRTVARAQAAGTIVSVQWSQFTIQTGSRRLPITGALTAAANTVTAGDFPYVYGGGHAEAGTASIGIKGPGYTGHTVGYDCSGSVAAVLSGAGLWEPGNGVPNDAGIIAQLRQQKLIARGVGTGAQEVTLYDDPGVHIFMNIDGRFFGTTDGGSGNPLQRNGGASWLDDGAPDAHSRAYHPWHLLPAALRG